MDRRQESTMAYAKACQEVILPEDESESLSGSPRCSDDGAGVPIVPPGGTTIPLKFASLAAADSYPRDEELRFL